MPEDEEESTGPSSFTVEEGGYEKLNAAIEQGSHETITIYPKTKGELKNTYQQLYGKSWQKHLSEDLARQRGATDKDLDKKAHNAARNFNPDRIENKPGKKLKEELDTLGRKHSKEISVPKNITGKRARITAVIWLAVSEDPPRQKTLDASNTKLLSVKGTNELKKGNMDYMIAAYSLEPGNVKSLEIVSINVDFV